MVAGNIGKLASQSGDSVKEISELIDTLSAESGKMLEIVDDAVVNAQQQKDNPEKTKTHFQKVKTGIEESLEEIVAIGNQAETCDARKENVTANIEELRRLSEDNVLSTRKTNELANSLTASISDTKKIAELVKKCADTLENQVEYFVME